MADKSSFLIIFIVGFGFSIIISLPAILLSYNLLSYDIINDSKVYYFPEDLSPEVNLNINADVGNIRVEYIESSLNTNSRIAINFYMLGGELNGKYYTDFFYIDWQTTNSSANLILKLLSNNWFDPKLWSMKNVSVVVYLRKDIIFNIITTVDEGNFWISVPWSVSIGNVLTNVSRGNIVYDFEYCTIAGNLTGIVKNGNIFYDYHHCTIEGNLAGIVNTGNIEFETYNTKYSRNLNWSFTIDEGIMDIFIYQYEDLGANITGKVHISDGQVNVFYDDNTANVGAILEIPYGNGFMTRDGIPGCLLIQVTCSLVWGFDYPYIETNSLAGIIYITSDDLITNIVENYYNIRIEIVHGSFSMDLTSIG